MPRSQSQIALEVVGFLSSPENPYLLTGTSLILWCTKGAGWLAAEIVLFSFILLRRSSEESQNNGPRVSPGKQAKKKGPTRPRSLAPRSGIREPFAAICDYGDHLPNEANYRATNRGGDAFDFVGAMIDRGFGWMIELIEDVVFHDRFENH